MNLNNLNDMQKKAVLQTEGPLLILAGAGSGKTRVITYRIAHLIDMGVNDGNILALTFTNKAAREMRERIDGLLGGLNNVFVSTFHSFCVRLLRRSIDVIGYKKSFTIYDDDDSKSLIKLCIKELGFDDYEDFDAKTVKGKISSLKNDNVSPEQFISENKGNFFYEDIGQVYKLYEQKLKANQALDFNDLLSKALKVLKTDEDVLNYYREKFEYIHVDEYQDTNKTQYELIKLLASRHHNICVVGDDDQSIYGWRGANIRNILDFEKDFKDTTVVRLEQNYRSTDVILGAANNLIMNNIERKKKKLWTTKVNGEKINYHRAETERDEAYYIVGEILKRIREENRTYKDFAVLYRTNSQSRVIEEYLMKSGIPYNVYGGYKFYSRKEIKDIIAYITVCVNPDEDISLRRIINTPKRGIGETTVEKLADYARENNISLFDALGQCENCDINSGAVKKIKAFEEKLCDFVVCAGVLPIGEFVEKIIDETGLIRQYEEKNTEDNLSKKENLQEFLTVAQDFEEAGDDVEIEDFLENILLVTDLDNSDDNDDKVSMMTLHSAKGLEFPVVFMVGMETGLFPSMMSLGENRMEEERRLCYVGMTRAKEVLYMTNAFSRNKFGRTEPASPSVFMQEIPKQYLNQTSKYGASNDGATVSKPTYKFESKTTIGLAKQSIGENSFSVGQKVKHAKYGVGTVIKVDGSGGNELVSVAFDDIGIKKLSTAFAPLKPL